MSENTEPRWHSVATFPTRIGRGLCGVGTHATHQHARLIACFANWECISTAKAILMEYFGSQATAEAFP